MTSSLPSTGRDPNRSWRASRRWAIVIVVAFVALAALSVLLAPGRLKLDTNTDHLLSDTLPVRISKAKYLEQFPQNNPSLVVVVDGSSPERVEQASKKLADALRARTDYFDAVAQPYAGAFFDRNGLLYLSQDELLDLEDRLAQSQPLLATLDDDPTLHGLNDVLAKAIDHAADFDPSALTRLLKRFNETLADHRAGVPGEVSWRETMTGRDDPDQRRQILFVYAKLDYQKVLAAGKPIRLIHEIASSPDIAAGGVRVRVTGKAALSYEELQTVLGGMKYILPLTTLLVALTLYAALRSVKLSLAAIVTLAVGLALTLNVATFVVGRLNLISIAFGVLFLGLASDFVIHLSMRLQEARARGLCLDDAIASARRSTTGALTMCAITTAVGFYAFWPTSFAGVSELGVIAGTGMFITLGVTLTLLPALWRSTPPSARSIRRYRSSAGLNSNRLQRIEHFILPVTAVAAIAGVFAIPSVRFDPDPLSLRSPNSQSVQAILDLQQSDRGARWTATALAPNAEQAATLVAKFKTLDLVDRVVSIESFIPKNQNEKLAIIDDMSLVVGPSLEPALPADPASSAAPDLKADLDSLVRTLRAAADTNVFDPALTSQAALLSEALSSHRARLDALSDDAVNRDLTELQDRWLGTFPAAIARLDASLAAAPITFDTLPADLTSRWISADGARRIDIHPTAEARQGDRRRQFVKAVQLIAPDALGPPIEEIESGNAVVHSFLEAMAIALVAITLIVWIYFRSLVRTLAVLTPLVAAALLTALAMTLLDMPFNFANVIALPLLFGIGVDSGIHIIHQAQLHHADRDHAVDPTTSRAIFFSALTTIASFGNLSISPHPGTASMGRVLTIGMLLILYCTLLVLPQMMLRLTRIDWSERLHEKPRR